MELDAKLPDYSEIDAALRSARPHPALPSHSIIYTADLDSLVSCARSAERTIAQVKQNLNLAEINGAILAKLAEIKP